MLQITRGYWKSSGLSFNGIFVIAPPSGTYATYGRTMQNVQHSMRIKHDPPTTSNNNLLLNIIDGNLFRAQKLITICFVITFSRYFGDPWWPGSTCHQFVGIIERTQKVGSLQRIIFTYLNTLRIAQRLSGWWLTNSSEKYEFVNWDIPNICKNKSHAPNHQSAV